MRFLPENRIERARALSLVFPISVGLLFGAGQIQNSRFGAYFVIPVIGLVLLGTIWGVVFFPGIVKRESKLPPQTRHGSFLDWVGICGALLCFGLAAVPERFPRDLLECAKIAVMCGGILTFMQLKALDTCVSSEREERNTYKRGFNDGVAAHAGGGTAGSEPQA